MIDYLLMTKVFFLSWFIVRFEPVSWLVDLLPNNIFKYIIVVLTTCLKCSNFWMTLLFTHDIFLASIMAFIGMLYEKTIGSWETKIKFN